MKKYLLPVLVIGLVGIVSLNSQIFGIVEEPGPVTDPETEPAPDPVAPLENFDADIEITYNSDSHTIVSPFEKSFRFVANIKNNGPDEATVEVRNATEAPEMWHILMPEAKYKLEAGEDINCVVTFEGGTDMENPQETSVTAPIEFVWGSETETVNVTVDNKLVDVDEEGDFSDVKFKVYDQETGGPVGQYNVLANYQGGTEQQVEICSDSEGLCGVELLSGDYLNQVASDYSLDQPYNGYLLQIAATGYKSYFDPDFQPGTSQTEVWLVPIREVGEYELESTIESGFSIWWIKGSADEEYFAFSQGNHGGPGVEVPDQTKVVMADKDGNQLWEKSMDGECWGLDISPDGQYVAAGCHDEVIHVWDRNGNETWTYANEWGGTVRWVKFSPDSRYLMSGPVDNQPEMTALFDVSSGEIMWTVYTGAYLREARFSTDGSVVYLASANGALQALDVTTGEELWLASGDYYIPFVLGVTDSDSGGQGGSVIAAGKGRAFTSVDSSTGQRLWQTTVDQTVTAGEVAEDGTIVASTVGGMGYKINSDGSILWAREYGGVGHNAVYYTNNGKYPLFGGPNPTLFDSDGNVLWQRTPDMEVQMSGPNDIDTGAAYVCWVSEDGSLIILGGDDGKIDFYKGGVSEGENDYSQLTGPTATRMGGDFVGPQGDYRGRDDTDDKNKTKDGELEGNNSMVVIISLGGLGVVAIAAVIIFLLKKKNQPKNQSKI